MQNVTLADWAAWYETRIVFKRKGDVNYCNLISILDQYIQATRIVKSYHLLVKSDVYVTDGLGKPINDEVVPFTYFNHVGGAVT